LASKLLQSTVKKWRRAFLWQPQRIEIGVKVVFLGLSRCLKSLQPDHSGLFLTQNDRKDPMIQKRGQ